jgi:hypothetical protein
MEKKQINEGVERIKDLMKKLVNEDIDRPVQPEPEELNYVDFECDVTISSSSRAYANVVLYFDNEADDYKEYELLMNYRYSPGDNGSYYDPPSGPDLSYDYIGGVTTDGEVSRKLTDDEMISFTHDEKIMMCIDEKLGESAGDYDSTDDYEYERDDY